MTSNRVLLSKPVPCWSCSGQLVSATTGKDKGQVVAATYTPPGSNVIVYCHIDCAARERQRDREQNCIHGSELAQNYMQSTHDNTVVEWSSGLRVKPAPQAE